jgi:hypothetical protein
MLSDEEDGLSRRISFKDLQQDGMSRRERYGRAGRVWQEVEILWMRYGKV